MVGQFPRKENSLVRHFSNHLTREVLNTKGENPDQMCKFTFLKIQLQQQQKTQGPSLYIYTFTGDVNHIQLHIQNFIVPTSESLH